MEIHSDKIGLRGESGPEFSEVMAQTTTAYPCVMCSGVWTVPVEYSSRVFCLYPTHYFQQEKPFFTLPPKSTWNFAGAEWLLP